MDGRPSPDRFLSVEPRGVEPLFPRCERSVLPLNEGPVAVLIKLPLIGRFRVLRSFP